MRDLEIRGSGALLGTGQSGHVAAVGYDLYCQLVNEEVAALKENFGSMQEISIELPIPAQIPNSYIPRGYDSKLTGDLPSVRGGRCRRDWR